MLSWLLEQMYLAPPILLTTLICGFVYLFGIRPSQANLASRSPRAPVEAASVRPSVPREDSAAPDPIRRPSTNASTASTPPVDPQSSFDPGRSFIPPPSLDPGSSFVPPSQFQSSTPAAGSTERNQGDPERMRDLERRQSEMEQRQADANRQQSERQANSQQEQERANRDQAERDRQREQADKDRQREQERAEADRQREAERNRVVVYTCYRCGATITRRASEVPPFDSDGGACIDRDGKRSDSGHFWDGGH